MMNTMGLAAISIALLLVAWRRWLERGEAASVRQGVLLLIITTGLFLWIVFVG